MNVRISYRSNRSKILNPIAKDLGIDVDKFKNKNVLVDEINKIRSLPRSDRCYNDTDPCTMQPIDDIEPEYYVEWTQIEKRFGADARTLRKLFETNNIMLPWSIDFSSGVQASIDHDAYARAFDMTRVEGLREEVVSRTSHYTESTRSNEIPFDNAFLFQMDMLLGSSGYAYGLIINKFIQNDNVSDIYRIVTENMFRLYYQLRDSESSMSIHTDIYYQYCYVYYTMQACHLSDKQEHLLFLLQVLTQFRDIVGEASVGILQMLFMDM